MKYILTILMLALIFIAGCGDEEVKINDTTDNNSLIEDTSITKVIECGQGEVETNGECLPIDPYGVLDEDVVEEQEIEPVVVNTNQAVNKLDTNTFEITAKNYEFLVNGEKNPELRVKQGDNITVILTSIGGSHNWNVRQLAARSKTVSTNETTTLEFVATTKGTFDYYCAVGRHQNIGMIGKFIVE